MTKSEVLDTCRPVLPFDIEHGGLILERLLDRRLCLWLLSRAAAKHDGYRIIVRRDGPAVRLYSRNAYDVILHAVEDDQSAPWRLDPVCLDLKLPLQLERLDRVVHELLGRLRQDALHLADTDDAGGALQQTQLDRSTGKEIRFAASTASPGGLIACRLQERLEDLSGLQT
jgi:hypothetical protein